MTVYKQKLCLHPCLELFDSLSKILQVSDSQLGGFQLQEAVFRIGLLSFLIIRSSFIHNKHHAILKHHLVFACAATQRTCQAHDSIADNMLC
jgi:hypothetical protein